MCRWLAYSGPRILLSSLILAPENSLIRQSRSALQGASVSNGDGFGVGWYDSQPQPGLFRDTLPAWNDENLCNVSEQVSAGLFLAHVRASTGTTTSRANCHPFRHDRWLFMHNGSIGGFEKVRRSIALAIDPRFFPRLQGNTDSEAFFYLLLSNGVETDPEAAFAATVGQVLAIMAEEKVTEPFLMTAALTDGEVIYAIRFSNTGHQPTLYYACGVAPGSAIGEDLKDCSNSILILSEPLDDVESHWRAVPESSMLIAEDGGVAVLPFKVDEVKASVRGAT